MDNNMLVSMQMCCHDCHRAKQTGSGKHRGSLIHNLLDTWETNRRSHVRRAPIARLHELQVGISADLGVKTFSDRIKTRRVSQNATRFARQMDRANGFKNIQQVE